MAAKRRRRGRRSTSQRLLILFNCVLVVLCLAAAGVFTIVRQKAAELPVVDIESAARAQSADESPQNFLLVGTDSSANLDKKDPVTKGRDRGEHLADVIMILRVDPKTKEAALMSIPRDTWVPIAPSWGKSKINSAFATSDGTVRLIETIKHNFGISIDHTMQVDFAGFKDVIEVLGGIPTYNTHPIRDRSTGLYLPVTGCIVIDPTQALAYARSRKFQYQDLDEYSPKGKWKGDGTGDLGRISRQQDFIRQAAQRAISQGIRNPTTGLALVNAALGSVKVDDSMTGRQIVDLIQTFRNFAVQDLKSDQLPTESGGSSRNSYQVVRWADAEGLLDVFRGIRDPGEVVPGDVIVGLPPDAPASGELASRLDAAGFDAGAQDSSVERSSKAATTTIRFGLRGQEAAQLLARHLDGPVDFEFSTELPGRRVELIPGSTPPEVRSDARPENDVPLPTISVSRTGKGTTTTSPVRTTTTTEPGSVGSSTPTTSTVSGETPSSLDDVTTTTAIGVVPLDAKAAAQCDG